MGIEGGGEGRVELTLKSPDRLQVTVDDAVRPTEALSSGMAMLIRLKAR